MIIPKPKPTIVDRARAYIGKMDEAIQGQKGDKQTFHVACKLVEFGLCQSDAMRLLLEYNERCKPKWTEGELDRKLRCAFARATPNPEFTKENDNAPRKFVALPAKPKWVEEKRLTRAQIVSRGTGLAGLLDSSPVAFSPERPSTVEILNLIFPGNPLLCCGHSAREFWTRPLSEFGRSVEDIQFVVPSPMSKLMGKIQDPRPGGPTMSAHTKDNTGDRRFAVVEFDEGSSDEHAALLMHLSEWAPFVMAVHSGGKSLHGWFYVLGEPEERVFRFYRYAVSIGADRATHLKSQFVRMPDGLRDNGKRQSVYYFDPSLLPK